jgi:hypothetical protein
VWPPRRLLLFLWSQVYEPSLFYDSLRSPNRSDHSIICYSVTFRLYFTWCHQEIVIIYVTVSSIRPPWSPWAHRYR